MEGTSDKRYIGIKAALLFAVLLFALSSVESGITSIVSRLVYYSAIELVLGIGIIFVLYKLFDRKPRDLFNTNNIGYAFLLSAGVVFFLICYASFCISKSSGIMGEDTVLILTDVVLAPIVTGFYEELHFRALICDGYYYSEDTKKNRLIYALISSASFGLMHVLAGWSLWRFLFTCSLGLSLATVYILSRSILVPMVIHCVIDIVAKTEKYIVKLEAFDYNRYPNVVFVSIIIMAVFSFATLLFGKSKASFSSKTDVSAP